MGHDKESSKGGGNYVGGLLQLFDWNAKSRKKFSSNSYLPEQSKQKKRNDGYLPMTQLQMLDEGDTAVASRIEEISDFRCASSIIDEEPHRNRIPGVVARLMGLDSMPKPNVVGPPNPTTFSSHLLCDAEYCQDPQITHSRISNVIPVKDDTEPQYQREMIVPIMKFRTEVLPPISVKSIPVTLNRLLSPVKSVNFIPSKDAAHIMEAAAKIIEPGTELHAYPKPKLPPVRSSSVPLRIKKLKEKAQASGIQSKTSEGSEMTIEQSVVKNPRGHSVNKSLKRSVDATLKQNFSGSEESSSGVRSRENSVLLSLQAKANVQKREGLTLNGCRSITIQKETGEFEPNQPVKGQCTTPKSTLEKQSSASCSNVLRRNYRKQNCIVKGKLPLTSKVQFRKAAGGGFSSARLKNSKLPNTSKLKFIKSGLELKCSKSEIFSSSSESVTDKKGSTRRNKLLEKCQDTHNMQMDKNGKVFPSSASVERKGNWNQDGGMKGSDVISFTFNAPLTRLGPVLESAESPSRSKRTVLIPDGSSSSKFSLHGYNVIQGDTLSIILEQKLKELIDKVEFSHQESGSVFPDAVDGLQSTICSFVQDKNDNRDGMHKDNLVVLGSEKCGINISKPRKLLDCQLLSPVSVLEQSSSADSCNSSDSADSNSTGDSKQCSAFQGLEIVMHSLNVLGPIEGYAELSDSASSTCAGRTVPKPQETTLISIDCEKPTLSEVEYVNEMLCNIEMRFIDYALGKTIEAISPCLYDQIESRPGNSNDCLVPRMNRQFLFDCVCEFLDLSCRRHVGGGSRLLCKGLTMVSKREILAEDICREISRLRNMGDSEVDRIIDKDMSCQYGRWLDYEIEGYELGIKIESGILDSLVNEVVADIFVLR